MATLKNIEFESSPLAVALELTEIDAEGWSRFRFSLTSDESMSRQVVSCEEQLSADDFQRLIEALRGLVSGRIEKLNFAPTEPSFYVRGERLHTDEIELIWFVDQGAIESEYSTETGVGIVMVTDVNPLDEFASALEREHEALKAE